MQINEHTLCDSLKLAWSDCYHYLIPKDATNANEELEVYKAWIEWFDAGTIDQNPMFNICLGYTLGDGVIDMDITELGMNEVRDIYLKQGRKALESLIAELETQGEEDE